MHNDRVGIIGPGRMGLAMVRHLVRRDFVVTAFDIDEEQLGKAVSSGANKAASAKDVARNSDYLIVAVGFEPEVFSCLIGPNGALDALAPGSCIAVCSTASFEGVQELERMCKERDIGFLDAPIARGRWAADDGTLLALVGGEDDIVRRSRPVFEAFCSDIEHVGAVGHGQVAKMMNNFLLWVNGCALIEAGRLAGSTGIDLARLRQVLLMSSGASAALRDWDRMTFTWALKDMQMLEKLSDGSGMTLPLAGLVKELVKDGRKIKADTPPDWTGEGGKATRP